MATKLVTRDNLGQVFDIDDTAKEIGIKLSADVSNALTEENDGLAVTNATLVYDANSSEITFTDNQGVPSQVDLSGLSDTVATDDTDSVTLSGTGAGGSPLTADVVLDPSVDNVLTSSASGLLVELTDAFGDVITP